MVLRDIVHPAPMGAIGTSEATMTTDMALAIVGGFVLGWVARAVIKAAVLISRSPSARTKYFRELETNAENLAGISPAIQYIGLGIAGVRALLIPGLVLAVLALVTR